MVLETVVFRRIISEFRQAGENAVEETMHEAPRWLIPSGHVKEAAKDRYQQHLEKIQKGD